MAIKSIHISGADNGMEICYYKMEKKEGANEYASMIDMEVKKVYKKEDKEEAISMLTSLIGQLKGMEEKV